MTQLKCSVPSFTVYYVQTALLFLIYITAIGYVMIGMCIFIGLSDGEVEGPFKDSINLLFAGGLLTTVFWVSFLLLLLCHDHTNTHYERSVCCPQSTI